MKSKKDVTLRSKLKSIIKNSTTYLDMYVKAKKSGVINDEMDLDEFIEYIQTTQEYGEDFIRKDEDFSKVTASIKVGTKYIELKMDDSRSVR